VNKIQQKCPQHLPSLKPELFIYTSQLDMYQVFAYRRSRPQCGSTTGPLKQRILEEELQYITSAQCICKTAAKDEENF